MARRFRGPLVREGVQTGDGRVIAPGAITWATLPVPLAWIDEGDQHINMTERAPQIGVIDTITRDASTGDLIGEGYIDDDDPVGAELVRKMDAGLASHGSRQFVSIDPDDWAMELRIMEEEGDDGVVILATAGTGPVPALVAAAGEPDDPAAGVVMFEDASDLVLQRYTRMRIRGATACAVSAFTEAWVELVDDEAPTDDGGEDPDAGVTASAPSLPARAPHDAFHLPEPDLDSTGLVDLYGMPAEELLIEQPDGGFGVPVQLVTRPDGTRVVFGHAARFEQCHVGFPGECVTAPMSVANYEFFHVGEVITDQGPIATGTLTIGTDHAAARLRAPAATDHYANTGLAWADVRAVNGAFGVWISGVVRDDVTPAQENLIRASSLSGDWRRIAGELEFIAALSVNVPGFPVAREVVVASGTALADGALTASAQMVDGQIMSLVASGIVQRCNECARRAMRGGDGMALLESIPDPRIDELLGLMRKVEQRTRPMTAAAAEHALAQIRR